ncbi:MAG: gliding motility-associated C-terminal domain-containing protein [Cryomorphaceae bacterium]
MKPLLVVLLLILCAAVQAQSPADWWYFGNGAGVHFEASGPVADTNGVLNTSEGVATISNNSGDLLFYTDGISVYNSQHQQMPNGFGLMGNGSSTQSGIIVPKPNDNSKYYIISVQELGYVEGMRYTLVDMTLEGGLGDVDTTQKNVPLLSPTCEKVAGVLHANGQDIWIVTHEFGNDAFHAFLVTPSGINTTAVVSNVGNIVPFASIIATLGYLRFSPSGDKLAAANHTQNNFELFDFNAATGEVSNALQISTTISPYCVEFSPDESLIYAAGWYSASVMQYDISSGNATTIAGTETQIGTGQSTVMGALQRGVDGKIYVAQHYKQYLAAIELPNVLGLGCSFNDSAVYLDGKLCTVGLPTFISSFFSADFNADNACFGDTVFFTMDTLGVDSAHWNFGDPSSGGLNSATGFNPYHVFTDTGNYSVTLIAYSDTLSDTAINAIYIYPRQTLDLGPDSVLCGPDTITLDVSQAFSSYLWSDGSIADTFVLYGDTTVWVTLSGVCDTLSDTVVFDFESPIPIDLGADTSFCAGNTTVLDPALTVNATWAWNTGDTSLVLVVSQTGQFVFSASNACGDFKDSIYIEVIPLPGDSTLLPPDSIQCFDEAFYLSRPDNDSISFVWSDSSTAERFLVDTTMTVWLAAFNVCGFSVDTMRIIFNGEIKTELGEDTVICDEDSIRLFGTDSLATYVWNTGDSTDTIVTPVGQSKNYIVTITLRQCQLVESREVTSTDTACPDIDCALRYGNVFTPNGDGWNDRFQIESDCELVQFSMSIYNRWGQLVHESDNIAYGWDGYVNGEPASSGTYFFTVAYRDYVVVSSDRFVTQGTFSLLR